MRSNSYLVAITLIAILTLTILPTSLVNATSTNVTNNFEIPTKTKNSVVVPDYSYKIDKINNRPVFSKAIDTPITIEPTGWNFTNNITITTLEINSETKVYDDTVLIVKENLTIVNSTIIFNTTAEGEGGILLLNGSCLKIVESTITYDGAKTYFIYAEANTTIEITSNSEIQFADIVTGYNFSVIGEPTSVIITDTKLLNTELSLNSNTTAQLSNVNIEISVDSGFVAISATDNSSVVLSGIQATATIVNAPTKIISIANSSLQINGFTMDMMIVDTLGGAGAGTIFEIVQALSTVTMDQLNITVNATGVVPIVTAYDVSFATVLVSNSYLDVWVYGLGATDLIMVGAGVIQFSGSTIKLHAYQGVQWGVLFEPTLGTIIVYDSYVLLDAYGYGGSTEYDAYLVIPIFAYLGGVIFQDSTVDYIGHGFAFLYGNYIIGGAIVFDTCEFNVKTYEVSFVYAAFFSQVGNVEIHNTNVSLPAFGDSLTLMLISTATEGGVYNITNSRLEGISSLLEGVVAVNSTTTVNIENTTMIGFTDAVVLSNVSNAVIKNSEFYNNTVAVKIGKNSGYGGEIIIENSVFANKEYNLDASYSANIKVIGSKFSKTTELGINFDSVVNITFVNNELDGLTFFLTGTTMEHYATHNITGNKVNGKDLLYVVNEKDKEYTGDIGALIIVNSTGITIHDIDLSKATVGIELAYVKDVSITGITSDQVKYGIYIYNGTEIEVHEAKFTYNERGIYIVHGDIGVYDSFVRFSTNGIYAEDSTVHVEKTLFADNGLGISASNTNIEIINSVIFRSIQYGIYLAGEFTKAEIHYNSIYSNRLHGIFSASNTSEVNASYNWWGVNNKGPEVKETGDPDDPEEIYGLFTNDTTEKYLDTPMWSPSEEGVIEAPEAPALPNYAIVAIIVVIGIIIAAVLYMRKPGAA